MSKGMPGYAMKLMLSNNRHAIRKMLQAIRTKLLQNRWTLHIEGDRKNLPKILSETGQIDLLHYDSDKSRAGRSMAMALLEPRMGENSVIVMDDIHDNLFFRDFAIAQNRPWRVFKSTNKYVGLIGL